MALLGGQIQFGVPSPGGPSMAGWKTVAEIVSDVAIEEGLLTASLVDPYGSPDQNILQLTALLKSAGKAVVRERAWSHLQRQLVFQTVAGQYAYGLPSDFREMVPQSGWDRTTIYRLGGPIGADVWQYAQAVTFAGTLRPLIRFEGGQIMFSPTPTAVQTIAFEYRSWFWVRPTGQTSPSADAPTLATDVIALDAALMVCALKLAWEKAKRMDTTTAQADYDRALSAAMNEDAAAPEIHLGKGGEGPKRIGWDNVPMTGIGQ